MTTPPEYQDYYNFLTEQVVTPFYNKRLQYLSEMTLIDVLKSKNPYMLKAKNLTSPDGIVRTIIDAFLSSQEETMFGNLLEGFAIHVSHKLYGGFKPEKRPSVDLEFERDNKYYIVEIKSGTNWANSSQIRELKNNFKAVRVALREAGTSKEIVAVNGCIYGKDPNPLKNKRHTRAGGKQIIIDEEPDKVYYKYAGQDFWLFISGNDNLYQEIIKPIDEEARERNETFKKTYNGKVNELALEFGQHFLDIEGQIDWVKLVNYVSKRGAPDILLSGSKQQRGTRKR
ncbi:MAG: hypothetical protein QOC96_710 [Acidobacteriota bacterium]|jgi:site-specific DNA-methyltransferase (cytosine-N4-specific)|nr:hypothetical protein [Acidobacteriota bacterium]